MNRNLIAVFVSFGFGILVLSGAVGGMVSPLDTSDKVKPSSYAPAKDLQGQTETLIERLHKDLASSSEYGAAQKERVSKDANTVAVLALVLGHHDQPNAFKKSAAPIIKAASAIAYQAEDYEKARRALANLDNALKAESKETPPWEMVGDSTELMLAVPLLSTSLRRNINGRRFAKSREKSAYLAAALAAIAQVSAMDDTYCADEAAQAKWAAFCIRMRDTAAGCRTAIREGNQDVAKDLMKKMTRACDDCHEVFQIDE